MIRLVPLSLLALLGACASAGEPLGPSTIAAAGFVPIGDVTLAQATGDQNPIPAVFRRDTRVDDIEVARSIALVQFDNWFAQEGVDLIVANTREIPLPPPSLAR